MADAPIPNQANYQDAQDFEINIAKIYSDFIQAIDKVRSTNNANNIRDGSVTNALSKATTIKDARSALAVLCDKNLKPQESRCHAFLRIIGFPCCDSSKSKIFNPGLDVISDPDRTVDSAFKLSVIKDPIPGFRDLSVTRETYSSTAAQIFNAQESIDAATLALSSGRNIRQFISPLTSTTFDDVDVSSQSYKIDFTSSVGGVTKQLTEYQDVQGKTPTQLGSFQFSHIMKPFLVDPVIDLTVNDSSKLIAVPFVLSKKQLEVKDKVFVARPMLEQIIRDRFIITNVEETSGTADQSVLDYIKATPNVSDVGIINSATDVYKLDDTTQFTKFLDIIKAMIKTLVDAQDDIRHAQDDYYWVPIPATTGPEGGCSVQGVFLSSVLSSDLITKNDRAINFATIKNAIAQASALAANINGTPDVGGFALPNALGMPNLGGSTAPDALASNAKNNLDALVKKRNAALKKAGDALRTVEIIMGEFSGLGLCDIIAVLGGLYLMKKESLLGFLDDDAFDRAVAANIGIDSSTDHPSIQTASDDFISVVKDMYNLMDKIYQVKSQNNDTT